MLVDSRGIVLSKRNFKQEAVHTHESPNSYTFVYTPWQQWHLGI